MSSFHAAVARAADRRSASPNQRELERGIVITSQVRVGSASRQA